MSITRSHCLHRGLFVLMGLLLAGPVFADGARDRGSLDEARQHLSVEGQRVEMQVRIALREAQSLLLKNDQDRAVARLKKALALLEDDTALPEARRGRLISMVKDRIRVAQADPAADTGKTDKKLVAAKRKDNADRRAADTRKIRRALDTITDLQKNGKYAEARRQARELAGDYPDNPAAQVATRNVQILDQLASARGIRSEKGRRETDALRQLDRDMMPPEGNMEINRAISKRNQTSKYRKVGPRLTSKEQAVLRALSRPITVRFQDSKFQDVIEYLSTLTSQPILLDKNALKEADIDYDTPVSVNVKGVSLRTVLRQVLGGFGLTYVVTDEVIQVVSEEKAKKMMTTRVYPVADLVRTGGLEELSFGPGVGNFMMMQNVAMLIDTIQSMTDRDSWKANGGEGTITFNAATMSLVIKQSAEVHSMLSGGLR